MNHQQHSKESQCSFIMRESEFELEGLQSLYSELKLEGKASLYWHLGLELIIVVPEWKELSSLKLTRKLL